MEAVVVKAKILLGEQPSAFVAEDAVLHHYSPAHHLVNNGVDLSEAELYQCLTSEPCYLEFSFWVFAQRKQGLQEKSSVNAQESLILAAEDVSLFHFKQDLLWEKKYS